ncbi:hypothetical protein D3C76_1500530 [compost metagenome]
MRPLRPGGGIYPLHLGGGQLILHHLHLPAAQGQRDLRHHPLRHRGGQDVGQLLARQRIAILIGELLDATYVFDVVTILAQDKHGIRQLGHDFIELRDRERHRYLVCCAVRMGISPMPYLRLSYRKRP